MLVGHNGGQETLSSACCSPPEDAKCRGGRGDAAGGRVRRIDHLVDLRKRGRRGAGLRGGRHAVVLARAGAEEQVEEDGQEGAGAALLWHGPRPRGGSQCLG